MPVLAMIALAAVMAAPTSALGKKKKKSSQGIVKVLTGTAATSTAVSTTVEATASCPAGTTALGGGFDVTGTSDTNWFTPTDSARVGETQWRAAGNTTLGTPGTMALTAEVYCAKVRGTVSTALTSTALGGANPDVLLGASCPDGTQLLSGGVVTHIPPMGGAGIPYRSSPTSRDWIVAVRFAGPSGTAGSVDALAYCLTPAKQKKKKKGKKGKKASVAKKKKKKPPFQNPRPLSIVTATGALSSTPLAISTVAVPACPGKTRVISGGYSSPVPSATAFAAYSSNHRTATGWSTAAMQFSDPPAEAAPLTAYAGCA
jgi:hypothetical protein